MKTWNSSPTCKLISKDLEFKLKEQRLENENLKLNISKKTQEVSQVKSELAEVQKKLAQRADELKKAREELEKINMAAGEVN